MIDQRIFNIMTTGFDVDIKTAAKAFKALVQIVTSKGVNVFCSIENRYQYGWNGKSIRLVSKKGACSARAVCDLAHEFAHYLCASPTRRFHREFGLGPGFSTTGYEASEIAPGNVIDVEENCACVLAAIILAHIGMPTLYESIMVNFIARDKDNNPIWSQWVENGEIVSTINRLISWGVIDNDLAPTFLPRQVIED